MKSITPKQTTGKAIEAKSIRELATPEEAQAFFRVMKERLKQIKQWHALSGPLSATFELVDRAGQPVNREPATGDYFKIDIPGPGSKGGEGFDWALVEAVKSETTDDGESYGIRVRPADNPTVASQDTAHFYSPESTSTFVVHRAGKIVEAAVYDRNIKPNTDTSKGVDQVRDAVIGTVGLLGFSKIQWQRLTDGLIGE
jgi:hypothetical protein